MWPLDPLRSLKKWETSFLHMTTSKSHIYWQVLKIYSGTFVLIKIWILSVKQTYNEKCVSSYNFLLSQVQAFCINCYKLGVCALLWGCYSDSTWNTCVGDVPVSAKHLQKPGPMRLSQVQPQIGGPQQSPGGGGAAPSPAPLGVQQQPTAQLSPGQPQQQQQQQQQPPIRRPTPNDKYIALELQKLQREKERLQREQDEIAAKVRWCLVWFRGFGRL